ncbi:hypothetical protein [Pseudomonas sp. HS6]|uniref:hypothetical protein n=1 Tax=Pseudomonas sp. HS6 TaxID=2850559 RepID=UPI002018D2F4|nr:hypothetical protein [Pseudomonas sp. HS6]UQS16401.1 hypothetical protein JJN09_05940 [Pseudomonas sp. HS6]
MSAIYPMLQPLVRELIAELATLGHSVTPDSCHHLIHAALGTVAPEIAAANNIPLQVRPSGMDDDRLQYNLYDTIRRAQKRLKIEHWPAARAAEEVLDALKKKRISVNQVELFLDSAIPRKVKRQAFKSLMKNLQLIEAGVSLLPKTATLAIEAGLVPAPDVSWEARFALTSASPFNPAAGIVDRVNNNKSYFWAFPPTWAKATECATLDHYFGEYMPTAEMGMGFAIIQAPWPRDKYPARHDSGLRHQYTVSIPIWSWNAKSGKWHLGNILRSHINQSSKWSRDELEPLLPAGLASLPRIHGCTKCHTLYIDKTLQYPEVPTTCSCTRSPGSFNLIPNAQSTS